MTYSVVKKVQERGERINTSFNITLRTAIEALFRKKTRPRFDQNTLTPQQSSIEMQAVTIMAQLNIKHKLNICTYLIPTK